MPNYISFKEDVDAWYRSQNNEWATVLSSLSKSYNLANEAIGQQVLNAANIGRQTAQTDVTSLYAQYTQSKQSLNSGGFTKTFTKGATTALDASYAATALPTYQTTLANNTPSTTTLSVKDSSLYKAYEAEVGAVSSAFENVFSYFNTSDNKTDVEFAQSPEGGLLSDEGELTGKGLMYLKYYLNGSFDDETTTDELYLSKGTLSSYLSSNVENLTKDNITTLGKMLGTDLSNPTFSDTDRETIFGGQVSTNPVQTAYDMLPLGPARNKYSANRVGYLQSSGAMVMNEDITTSVLEALEIEDVTVNGISASQAITMGALQNGDTFTQDGIEFVVYNNKLLVVYSESTIQTLKTKGYNIKNNGKLDETFLAEAIKKTTV